MYTEIVVDSLKDIKSFEFLRRDLRLTGSGAEGRPEGGRAPHNPMEGRGVYGMPNTGGYGMLNAGGVSPSLGQLADRAVG
jgi:hypothetical protein